MKVNPDFSEIVTPNKPGEYICAVMGSELKYGQASGLPYVNWKLKTYPEGRFVFHSTPISGRGAGMFKHFIHSCGDTAYVGGEYETGDLVNKLVSMVLTVDEKGYFVVKSVSPLSDQQIADYGVASTQPDDIAF